MKKVEMRDFPPLSFEVEEALNQLRINIGFCGKEIRVIMVTSSTPNEGKSFISIHLWKMMADMGLKTLLVDCDIRNSTLRTKYGLYSQDDEAMQGTVHYLSGRARLEDSIYQLEDIPSGCIMPVTASVGNPAILLENERLADLFSQCRNEFDYIIVDTPPIGVVADAMRIAEQVDGMILTVRSGRTSKKVLENSMHLLERTGVPLLGTVLNGVDIQGKSNSYYRHYYKKYGYGGGYYHKTKENE